MSGLMTRSIAALLGTIFLISSIVVPLNTEASDQAHSMVDFFSNPADTMFYGVTWNGHDYHYAVAVGINTTSNHGVIYRYDPDTGWTSIYTATATDTYYDIVYDTYLNTDTFYVVGTDGTYSLVLKLENAGSSPSVSYFGSSPGAVFRSAAFDPHNAPHGTLTCAGWSDDGSGNTIGLIAWHDMSLGNGSWSVRNTGKYEKFNDITFNGGEDTPLYIAVGANESAGLGIAYGFNYDTVWKMDTPQECTYFHSVSWYAPDPDGYAIAVGESSSGGVAYRIDVNFPGISVSYANSNNPKSLKYVFGANEGHFSIPAPFAYANFTSIAVNKDGNPTIAYYNSFDGDLMFAYFNGKRWLKSAIDTDGDVGRYCSLDLLNFWQYPYIAYQDAGNGSLKFAWYNGSAWSTGVLDSSGTAGKYIDMVIDSSNHVHISYLDTSQGLKYAYYNGSTWSIQVLDSDASGDTSIAVDSNNEPYIVYERSGGTLAYRHFNGASWQTDGFPAVNLGKLRAEISIDGSDRPHIAAFYNSQVFLHMYKDNSTWHSENISVSSDPNKYASDGDIYAYPDGGVSVVFSYVNSTRSFAPYSINYTFKKGLNGPWEDHDAFDWPDTGVSPSIDFFSTFRTWFVKLAPADPSATLRPFFAVDWSPDGKQATLVGETGQVYLYYPGNNAISLWNADGPGDLYNVAVKPPRSPAYALVVGSSSSGRISYQVADTSTVISADVNVPHINEMDFMDKNNNSMQDRQVDVGSTYKFWLNTSYAEGWERIAVNITCWYDMYDGFDEGLYNETAGKNNNFMLHYEPDPVDPFNRSGNWSLLWPDTEEVTLESSYVIVEDNPNAGSPGINDGHDFYHLFVEIHFGKQLIYAPGDGTWNPPSNNSSPDQSFNDHYSWNFQMEIYDRNNHASNESRYGEFGIYAYTEISASGSPGGSGAPGTHITLSPEGRIYLSTNVEYNVTVNITDLKNADNSASIPRSFVEVINKDPNGYNTTSNTDISTWTAFPSSPEPLFVWGTSSGNHLQPLPEGTNTAGYTSGYSSSPAYTVVMWRIFIPAGTQEDRYTATITYTVDYV